MFCIIALHFLSLSMVIVTNVIKDICFFFGRQLHHHESNFTPKMVLFLFLHRNKLFCFKLHDLSIEISGSAYFLEHKIEYLLNLIYSRI